MESNIKNITLDDWKKVGGGANADSYYNEKNNKIMLKLSKKGYRAEGEIQEEINIAKITSKIKINTPKVIDIVKYKDRYGIIYERLLNKQSIGKLCHDNPYDIDYYAKIYAKEATKFHNLECNIKNIPDIKKYYIKKFESASFDENLKKEIINILKTKIQNKKNYIHRDMSFGNLIIANNKKYWIDLGGLSYGDPIIDLSITYFDCRVTSKFFYISNIFHLNYKQINQFLDAYIKEYARIKKLDLDKLIEQLEIISIVWYHKIWIFSPHKNFLVNFVKNKAIKYHNKILSKYNLTRDLNHQ